MTNKPMTEHEKAKAAQRELYRRRMQDPAYRARKNLTALKQEQKEKKCERNGTHH